jgi:hypothetical protein
MWGTRFLEEGAAELSSIGCDGERWMEPEHDRNQ